MSIEVGYSRRWLQNFTVTDNLNISPADFDQFSLVAPSDPRLPGGGGYTISGLYNVKPDKFSAPVNNLRTYAPDYGTISQVYNGLDFNIYARMRNGLQLQAGTTTGQRVTDYCDVRGKMPEQTGGFSTASEVAGYSPVNPFCHVEPGITTRFTSAGTYIVPKVDVHGVRHVPELAGRAAPGELDGVERNRARRRSVVPLVRQRPERHGQPACSG